MKKREFSNLQIFAEETNGAGNIGNEPSTDSKITAESNNANIDTTNTNESNSDEQNQKNEKAKYTDEDVNELINRKFAEWQKKHEKDVSEAKKLAEMNATEKAEYEASQLREKLERLEKEQALSEMAKTARKMLSDENISINDELLTNLICEDAEKTKVTVQNFAKMFKESVQESVKSALKGTPPKIGHDGKSLTKEQIMNIKNPSERKRLIAENIDLFDSKGE